jgi:hypothetical protein
MNVAQLKEYLKDIPDDVEVMGTVDYFGDDVLWLDDGDDGD